MAETVGSALLDEIERVSAKRERWRGYAETAGAQADFALPIALMTAAIDEAKAALHGDDPVRAMRALDALKGYSDDD